MRGLPIVAALCLVVAGCASSGAVPRPFPVPGGAPAAGRDPGAPGARPVPSTPPDAAAGEADGYSLSTTALALRGAPYRHGGSDPAGFDCSGFVQYVFQQHGLALPRAVREQFDLGQGVSSDALEPGDLVFFSTIAPGASHVGIAIGGDQFVHAPSSRGVVRVERLGTSYWSRRFVGARRVN